MKTNRKIPSVNSILDKLGVLLIILAIAVIFYFTRSVLFLIIVAALLIFIRYMELFSEKSEDDMPEGYEKKPSKLTSIIPVLKKIWVVMILLSIFLIAFTFNNLSRPTPPSREPEFENIGILSKQVPEGTAYVDILCKIDSSDETYTDFNVVPQNLTVRYDGMLLTDGDQFEIDENSEIAKYNDDGYMSLSLHSTDVWFYDLHNGASNRLLLNCSVNDLYKKYKGFKLAYVGEHGEVLGVTKKASHRYDSVNDSAVVAKGDKVTYREFVDISYLRSSVFIIIFLTFPVSIIVLSFKPIVQKISWDSWVREQTRKKRG